MPKSNGFFYDVAAVVDKASFASAKNEVQKLAQAGASLVKGLAGISTAIVGTATAVGVLAQEELRMSRAIGLSTEAMDAWKTSASLAGVSGNGLISVMSSLETKMQHLKTGTVDMNLAKNLGMLGIGYGDFANMDAEDRMRAVMGAAQSMDDQKLAATLVSDVLGEAGRDYYNSLQASGKSLDAQLAEARSLNFVTEANRKNAAAFTSEAKAIGGAFKSIGEMLGGEIAGKLLPTATRIKNYIIQNKALIQKAISGIAEVASTAFKLIAGTIEKVVPFVMQLVDGFGGLDRVIYTVGIGLGALKLTQVAGGIGNIIKQVGSLKGLLKGGLLGAGAMILIDDILGYFQGKKSITGEILKFIDEVKEKINFDDKVEGLKESFANLAKIIEGEKFQTGLQAVMDFFVNLGGNVLETAIDLLGHFIEMLTNLANGDWQAALNSFGEMGTDSGNLIAATLTGTTVSEVKDRNTLLQNAQHLIGEQKVRMYGENDRRLTQPLAWGDIIDPAIKYAVLSALNAGWDAGVIGVTGVPSVQDGIISPNGRIASVAPDDWVFAVKDISNLAQAFMPGTGAMQAVTVNLQQTINVDGGFDVAETVRKKAYSGAADALRDNMKTAVQYLQYMPGTR